MSRCQKSDTRRPFQRLLFLVGLETQLDLLTIAYKLANSIRSFFENLKVFTSGHEEFNKAIHEVQSNINGGMDAIKLHPDLSNIINYLQYIEGQLIPLFFDHWTQRLKSEVQASQTPDQMTTAGNSASLLNGLSYPIFTV